MGAGDRNTPAATIVAAWISAETGVGPSIASGSHVCSGTWPDLPIAPTSSSSEAAAETVSPPMVVAPGQRSQRAGFEQAVSAIVKQQGAAVP
jgi:hypothetical protein